MALRLDRYIGNNTELTRREVKFLLKAGEITVNDEVPSKPGLHLKEGDVVAVQGRVVEPRQPRYFMLHKPPECISARSTEEHLGALDLIEEPFHDELHIVGRLDLDTTGLLLVTDDGQWSQRLRSPRHKVPKVYWVTTAKPIASTVAARFEAGIYLKTEDHTTAPAQLDVVAECRARLTITEGKFHQVKRMFAAVDNEVTALHRASVGEIVLDEDLEPGEYRALTAQEIQWP
ncbi:ribosomal small subunit pseudouridine synthase A [gamma proteobacterium HTCC5015]|nr:ribosomal small subunit pseudouridine synthase A [gamma proteobacterium HTCC5015]